MARVTGKNGAVTAPTGINADFNSWAFNWSHAVDDDTAYDTLVGASHSGSGSISYSFDVSGFLKSNVASSAPGVGLATGTVVAADVDGATVTLTAHTGCTFAGTGIFTGGGVQHARKAGAIPIAYSGVFDGDVTETWATT